MGNVRQFAQYCLGSGALTWRASSYFCAFVRHSQQNRKTVGVVGRTGHVVLERDLAELRLCQRFPLLIDLSLVTDEVRTLGENYAVEIGHSAYQALSEDGKTSAGSDNYEVVWHRGEDGVWHYVTDMFNSR